MRGLEIGCYEGRSTLAFLDHVLTHPESTIDTVDPWVLYDQAQRDRYATALHNLSEHPDCCKVSVWREVSDSFCRRAAKNHYDFAYIDGSHIAGEVLSDCLAVLPLLKAGGIMLCDDYLWPSRPGDGPKEGIDRFVLLAGDAVRCIHSGYQIAFEKV